MIKKILFIALLISVSAVFSFAQETRQPSTPTRPFTVKTRQSLADLERSIGTENKAVDLIGGEGMQLRVAVQHDETRPTSQAELHDDSDDVYYVLEGEAQLTLGGKLENPREISTGEWRSEKIIGGEIFIIKKGDLIIVPRGTPHHRINVKGKKFSLILIKVFATPLPAPKK